MVLAAVDRLTWPAYKLRHTMRAFGTAAGSVAAMIAIHGYLGAFQGVPPPTRAAQRAMRRRLRRLIRQDLSNVEAGVYDRSLVDEHVWREMLRVLPQLVREAPEVAARRSARRTRELPTLPEGVTYPDYYLQNFHWQTDGWFSDRSAALYGPSVELLFAGTAAVMRRQALVPIWQRHARSNAFRLLDVACGTGDFLRQFGATFPKAERTGLDLSRPYLARMRAQTAGAGRPVTALESNAEAIAAPDGHFDVSSSIFLFHELPKAARRKVLAEMRRVTRPGGLVVVMDSGQSDDAADIQSYLDAFPEIYHEPYYRHYLRDPIEAIMREVGLPPVATESHGYAKLVWAEVPPGPA